MHNIETSVLYPNPKLRKKVKSKVESQVEPQNDKDLTKVIQEVRPTMDEKPVYTQVIWNRPTEGDELECPICDDKFLSLGAFVRHLKQYHGKTR